MFSNTTHCHGNLFTASGTTDQNLSVDTREILVFEEEGPSFECDNDLANNRIRLFVEGTYLVLFTCTFTGSNSSIFNFQIHAEGVVYTGVGVPNRQQAGTKTDASGGLANVAFSGLHVMSGESDFIAVYLHSDGSVITVQNADLTVIRI